MTTTRVIMSYPWGQKCNKDSYICTLAAEVLGVAKSELREDESGRAQALMQLREWIKKNYDIHHCRTDDSFLLRFLRVKKFSVPMAQTTILKYLNLRQTFPHLCMGLDFLNPSVKQLIESGYIFASPIRDSQGRRVIIGIANNFNPYKYSNEDMAKAHLVTYETLLEDEESQIMGFTHFGDLKGVSAAHITLWGPTEFATVIKWGEQSIPMRHKEIHLINVPAALRYVYDFARTRFSPKMRSRFTVHSSLEDCHTKLDPKVLPKEYGGVIPMSDMIDMWKKEVASKREKLLSLDKMKLLNNKNISAHNQLNNAKNKSEIMNLTGSFKKLEVD
ncbi:alpha-tocopherol transfer protein-like [Nilaparvata lugens]|uniref:alpha-tocopherol transfer protein-like n=1 Tax=Nilaparvata lugens TaxID=108931 RepID=UPI00193EBD39|nr:alpha-tocopherol transfer protein-like [Nilaparvata lugens]XP_039286269.1 alpha-tocopherol transfer protein-like [Nilaparvata lugens]